MLQNCWTVFFCSKHITFKCTSSNTWYAKPIGQHYTTLCLASETCFVSPAAEQWEMTVKQLPGLMCHSSRHLSSVYLEPLHVTSFHQPPPPPSILYYKLEGKGARDKVTSKHVCNECYITIVGYYQLQNNTISQKTPTK